MKYAVEYLFIKILFGFLYLLPISLVSLLGGKIFRLLGTFSKSHKTAISNFKKIYSTKSNKEITNEVKKSWENLGKTIFEISILNKIVDYKNKKIKIEGMENISKLNKKNPIIFFAIHQSNWEILLPTINNLGINSIGIYRHINNKYIDNLILYKRNKSINSHKNFYSPKGKKSAKDMIDAIKNNTSILLLIDQKDSAGSKIKLFNQYVNTQTGFLKIARKNNLKLIPIKNTRHGINNFTIKFYPPLKNYKDISDIKAMTKIHSIIEKWILQNPSQWLWQHNRFD